MLQVVISPQGPYQAKIAENSPVWSKSFKKSSKI